MHIRAAAPIVPSPIAAGPAADALPRLERAVLWAVRVWVAGQRLGLDLSARIQGGFDELGAFEAGACLDALLQAMSGGARRPLEVRCLCQPRVSADEATLLDALTLAQAGLREAALARLGELLLPEAVLPGCEHAVRLADELAVAGQLLHRGRPLGRVALPRWLH